MLTGSPASPEQARDFCARWPGMLRDRLGWFVSELGVAEPGLEALDGLVANVPLLLAGLGFGLALAPINAAVLATTDDDVHGLASALVVVARMVGMLVGISALTSLGLRAFYRERDGLPLVGEVCGDKGTCKEYNALLLDAALTQEQVVFAGAAVCADRLEGLVLVPESAISSIQSPPSRLTEVSAATSAVEG